MIRHFKQQIGMLICLNQIRIVTIALLLPTHFVNNNLNNVLEILISYLVIFLRDQIK